MVALLDSIEKDGVNVKGYFAWSYVDNFEWKEGYRRKFGMLRFDPKTKNRIEKNSFKWFCNFIKE